MQVSVRLNSEVQRKLTSTINATHKPRNAIINEALEFYLDSLNVDALEKDVAAKMQALNAADNLDDCTEIGDFI